MLLKVSTFKKEVRDIVSIIRIKLALKIISKKLDQAFKEKVS